MKKLTILIMICSALNNITLGSIILPTDSVIASKKRIISDISFAAGISTPLFGYGATQPTRTPSSGTYNGYASSGSVFSLSVDHLIGLDCSSCSTPIANPLQTTTYTVTVVSDSGCISYAEVTIDVTCDVFVPKAFSPNNDGQNDELYVRGDCIKSLDFMVFDRWGNKVFETTDKNIPWDGRYKGEPMNTGSYVYYLTATLYDSSSIQKKGDVALVR